MGLAESFREAVTARAGGACECCRLLEMASGVTFHIEHVKPLSLGGETILHSLALSCPGCNLAKSTKMAAMNLAGQSTPLYNPRHYRPGLLGWHLHFRLDRETGKIIPRSPIGLTTVGALAMNSETRAFARRLQIEAGLLG